MKGLQQRIQLKIWERQSCPGQVEDKPKNDTVAMMKYSQKVNQTNSWYFWDTRMVTGKRTRTWMVTVEVTGTWMLMGQMTGTIEGDGGSDRGADGGNDGPRTMNCGMDGLDSDYSHHWTTMHWKVLSGSTCRPSRLREHLWELSIRSLSNGG